MGDKILIRNLLLEAKEAETFDDFIAFVDKYFMLISTGFNNNGLKNNKFKNEGSLKVLAFAKYCKMTDVTEIAGLFKGYYKDVLKDPKGDNHQNIRHLINGSIYEVSFDVNIVPLNLIISKDR
ncbi:hypothetical protein HOG21_05480 [bacterium]|nr:hypothetical protein [bacterium]